MKCRSLLMPAIFLFIVSMLSGCSNHKHLAGVSCYLTGEAPIDQYAEQVMPTIAEIPDSADIYAEYVGDLSLVMPCEYYFLKLSFPSTAFQEYLEQINIEREENEAFLASHQPNFYMYPKGDDGKSIPFDVAGFRFAPEDAVEVKQGAKTAIIRLIGVNEVTCQVVYLCFYDELGSSVMLNDLLTVNEICQSLDWN